MIKEVIIGILILCFIGLTYWELHNPPAITNQQILPLTTGKWAKGICLKKFLDKMENPIFIKINQIIPQENSYAVSIFTPKKGVGVTTYEITSSKISFTEANELTSHPFCPKE